MNLTLRRLASASLAVYVLAAAQATAQTAPVPAAAPAIAPAAAAEPDMALDATARAQAIDELTTHLTANYVFPEVAAKMTADLRRRQQGGEYDRVTSARAFAKLLQEQMQAISHDKHLGVRFREQALPAEPAAGTDAPPAPSAADLARRAAFERNANFGFAKYEQLDGNIAYMELRGFFDAEAGAATAAAAMNLVANADALIIDLRRNGGGSPGMVALVTSYLFGAERVHLNDLYWRAGNRTEQFWTKPDVAGTRYGPDKPVYILTSKRTFSAAEEFTYNLKNLKRAVIVGETTGGGANPGRGFRTGAHFSTFIPTGRAINPVSKTNWEGTGVTPDIAVAADQALLTAQLQAMKTLAGKITDPQMKARAAVKMNEVQASLDGMKKQ